MKNKEEIRQYGFKRPEVIEPKEWKLGNKLAGTKYSVNWEKYLPKYEVQTTEGGDETSGCTVWGTQNIKETLLMLIEGKEYNFSERFNYISAGVTRDGADPHKVAEDIRHNRVVDQEVLPMVRNYEDFIKPNPIPAEIYNKASEFPWELNHWWIWTWNDRLDKERRAELIRENLAYSPLGVSVTAWRKKNGVYIDNGRPNTHWCMLFGEEKGKGWKVFDSYDHAIKILSYDHNIEYCKGYDVVKKPAVRKLRLTLIEHLKKLVELLTSWLKTKEMTETKPNDLLPLVKQKTDEFIKLASDRGYTLRVTSGFRSIAEQDAIYAQGRTKPGRIVTNAKGGESFHNYGVAIDIVDRFRGYDIDWDELGILGESLGFEWGGSQKWIKSGFVDKPHFQMPLDYSLDDFQKNEVDYSKWIS